MTSFFAFPKYLFKASTKHGVHSPFVYGMMENVLQPSDFEKKNELHAMRKQHLQCKAIIEIEDHGAGSKKFRSNRRSVRGITQTSSSSIRNAGMLQRLSTYCGATNILELGTNLGFTTAALAAAPQQPKVVSIEGDQILASMARKNVEHLKLDAHIIEGPFDRQLQGALEQLKRLDMAYIDGNHALKPTLRYFEHMLPYVHASSVVVIGDIHWSGGMEAAWREIINRPEVTLTIDVFQFGFVFFDPERRKQHFTLLYI